METIEKAIEILNQTNMVKIREIENLCQIAQESSSELMQLECIMRIAENVSIVSKNSVYVYADAYADQKEGEIANISTVLDALLDLRNDNIQKFDDILNEYVEFKLD